jgi:hypothetical protein
MQGLAVIALPIVHRGVADPAQVMKERTLCGTDRAAVEEPVNELVLPLLGANKEPELGGGALRQHLTELTELEEGNDWVGREVLLGLRGERNEARVVMGEVSEVLGWVGVHGMGIARQGMASGTPRLSNHRRLSTPDDHRVYMERSLAWDGTRGNGIPVDQVCLDRSRS